MAEITDPAGIELCRELVSRQPRIGIYSGAFDPVHSGHIAFALQAVQAAQLDEVIFLPERRPRYKPGVEHYAHRMAMIRRALEPHPLLSVMETVDRHYSVHRTLPQLRALLPGVQLAFLMGSDAALSVPTWPGARRLLQTSELIVGIRAQHQPESVGRAIADWEEQPRHLTLLQSYAPAVSSAQIRNALRRNQPAEGLGLLASVRRYAEQEWLYVSASSLSSS